MARAVAINLKARINIPASTIAIIWFRRILPAFRLPTDPLAIALELEERYPPLNDSLASELGLNAPGLEADELAAVFAGNVTPPGAEPIARAYAGLNSAISFLSLAMAAQSSSARS